MGEWCGDVGFCTAEENFEVSIGGGEVATFEIAAVIVADDNEVLYFEIGCLSAGGVVAATAKSNKANGKHEDDGEANDYPGKATAE